MKKFLISCFFAILIIQAFSQNYESLKIKEEYDLFNSIIIGNAYTPCIIEPK